MIYIYCGSHLSLLFAVSLKNKGNEITAISSSEDVKKYCNDENINFIKLEYIRPTLLSIHKLFKLKKMLNNTLEKIKCSKGDIYFLTGTVKGYESYYLAKELFKKGFDIHYTVVSGLKFKKLKNPWYKPIFIRGIITRLALKLILGLDLKYYTNQSGPLLGIDDKFIKKYNFKKYEHNISNEELILEVAKSSKSSNKTFENVIVDQGSFGDVLKPGTIKNLYKKLSEIPVEYNFKKHPVPTAKDSLSDDPTAYDIFKHCDQVPRYIPVELLINNINNSIISIFVPALVTASHFDHLKSISLMELVDFTDESYKKKIKNSLIEKSNNKIQFPSSFEELNNMLLK